MRRSGSPSIPEEVAEERVAGEVAEAAGVEEPQGAVAREVELVVGVVKEAPEVPAAQAGPEAEKAGPGEVLAEEKVAAPLGVAGE